MGWDIEWGTGSGSILAGKVNCTSSGISNGLVFYFSWGLNLSIFLVFGSWDWLDGDGTWGGVGTLLSNLLLSNFEYFKNFTHSLSIRFFCQFLLILLIHLDVWKIRYTS